MQELAERYEEATGWEVVLSSGSTGKLYAQTVNGGPYDVFLAADSARPLALEDAGLTVAGSRFTYALGRLVLWSPQADLVDDQGAILESGDFAFLAIANPDLAPYGSAAREVLSQRGIWEPLQSKIVRGENINQSMQYVQSGNAQLGFVAWSQLQSKPESTELIVGSKWIVPTHLHSPIAQQAVLLRESPAARIFLDFIRSPAALDIIQKHGYDLPS